MNSRLYTGFGLDRALVRDATHNNNPHLFSNTAEAQIPHFNSPAYEETTACFQ